MKPFQTFNSDHYITRVLRRKFLLKPRMAHDKENVENVSLGRRGAESGEIREHCHIFLNLILCPLKDI